MSSFIVGLMWFLLFAGGGIYLAYNRVNLATSTAAAGAALFIYSIFGSPPFLWLLLLWLLFGVMVVANLRDFRREKVTRPALAAYRKMLPSMSETEREALEAGSIWWDGELFSGMPDWDRLMSFPPPKLSAEEQAFLDGPCEQLCRMLDDWEICHERGDMPPDVWAFIKKHRFFAMIIPKKYGGLEFSAYANAMVIARLASRSTVASSTVGVPNSLGPAELLLHYGTEEQKQRYLPGLASAEEIPCFALTSPQAGSDAAALIDSGIVCKGEWQGEEIIGIRLTWEKRYITLAPVATLLGLAFRLRDPGGLLGRGPEPGITVALVPAHLPGIETGRRHDPMGIPFPNGPIRGEGVVIPTSAIIGGPEQAGRGWKMLMEALSAGRSVSLPAQSAGGAKKLARVVSAYAVARRQFGLPIGRFEAIEERLAAVGGLTYLMEAARVVTCGALDAGHRPAVVSAIVKYNQTELLRQVLTHVMDVMAGAALCRGPSNPLPDAWAGAPIGITVEGANILTRTLIIFGQGAIRAHPYVLREMRAAKEMHGEEASREFDDALTSHIGHVISNGVRALVYGLTHASFAPVPENSSRETRHYYRHVSRLSAAFAFLADMSMLAMGGALKRKEKISGRLGDVLSMMYLVSATLKRYEDQGRLKEDLPLVRWSVRDALYRAQQAIDQILSNFPVKSLATLLRFVVFPLGMPWRPPLDSRNHECARIALEPGAARDRLTAGMFVPKGDDATGQLEAAFLAAVACEPIEKKLREAVKAGVLTPRSGTDTAAQAREKNVITTEELAQWQRKEALRKNVIKVDDFPQDFGRADIVRASQDEMREKPVSARAA